MSSSDPEHERFDSRLTFGIPALHPRTQFYDNTFGFMSDDGGKACNCESTIAVPSYPFTPAFVTRRVTALSPYISPPAAQGEPVACSQRWWRGGCIPLMSPRARPLSAPVLSCSQPSWYACTYVCTCNGSISRRHPAGARGPHLCPSLCPNRRSSKYKICRNGLIGEFSSNGLRFDRARAMRDAYLGEPRNFFSLTSMNTYLCKSEPASLPHL